MKGHEFRGGKETTLFLDEFMETSEGYALDPERSLLSALLFDGVQCYLSYATASSSEGRIKFREAQSWVQTKDVEYVFSFDNVCDALGINAEYLRLGLMNIATTNFATAG